MSPTLFSNLARKLQQAMADAAWAQWRALGGQVSAREPASIVDPEALVLASLWLKDDEPRFWDLLAGFAHAGSRLLSVQRLRRLAERFPSDAVARVGQFARVAAGVPGDPRWRALAGSKRVAVYRSKKVAPPAGQLTRPGALLLRFRTAFGVDVRTDALAYLLGKDGARVTVSEVAADLGYADNTVRGACEALANARLISAEPERPARYHASSPRWSRLLEMPAMPRWHPWWQGYLSALALRDWLRGEQLRRASPTAAGILTRDWVQNHRAMLAHLGLEVPDPRDSPGGSFLRPFEALAGQLVDWLGKCL